MSTDTDKRLAAETAVAEVMPGMLVGLGTGSTAAFAITALGERIRQGLSVTAVATSRATETLTRTHGIPLLAFDDVPEVDLTIDGVDEIDPDLRAIKGAGGALLREKIVAAATRRMIAVADGTKSVTRLGRGPVPVELLPFGRASILRRLAVMGATVTLRNDLSDQDNLLGDASFGPIADPAELASQLNAIPGLLGHGLFVTEIDDVFTAAAGVVTRHRRPQHGAR